MEQSNVIDFTRRAPWEGLATDISNEDSIQAMLVKSGADFHVEKVPNYIKYKGQEIDTGRASLIRTDNDALLSSVPIDWKVNQNKTAFEFFRRYVVEGSMSLEHAGVFDQGRNVFVLARLNQGFTIKFGKKRDDIDQYLLFSNPHRYGWSISIAPTGIRPACLNMLVQALGRAKNKIRIPHDMEFDPEAVHQLIAISQALNKTYEEKAKFIASRKARPAATVKFFDKLFPTTSDKLVHSRNTELLYNEVLEKQPGAELGAGTWWANFNAVTYFVDHMQSKNDNTRLESALYGGGRDLKLQALDLAVDFAKKAA